MTMFRLRDLAKTPYERVKVHQLLFGKSIPDKNFKGKYVMRIPHPKHDGKRIHNGTTNYLYNGLLTQWVDGRRVPLPGVEISRGMYGVSEEMAEKVRRELKRIGVG